MGYAYNVESNLYIVDAYGGAGVKIAEGWARVKHVAWSPDGRYIAYTAAKDELRPYLVDLVIYDVASGQHKVLASGLASDHHIAWGPGSDAVAIIGHKMPRGLSSHNRVYVYWLDGTERCLTCNFDRNVVNTLNSDVRGPSMASTIQWIDGWIYFIAAVGGYAELYGVDLEGRVERVIGGEGAVDEFAIGEDGAVLYTYMEPTAPKELYLYRDGSSKRLTAFNDLFLSRIRLSRPQRFSFKASDGVEVEGWVPPEKVGEKTPWVLCVHGGPKTAWGYSFMFEFQLLAAKGFAVAYVNPRGSDGYNEEFADIL